MNALQISSAEASSTSQVARWFRAASREYDRTMVGESLATAKSPGRLGLASTPMPVASAAATAAPGTAACAQPAFPPGSTVFNITNAEAGYRAQERFAGIAFPHEAVARTQTVSGW